MIKASDFLNRLKGSGVSNTCSLLVNKLVKLNDKMLSDREFIDLFNFDFVSFVNITVSLIKTQSKEQIRQFSVLISSLLYDYSFLFLLLYAYSNNFFIFAFKLKTQPENLELILAKIQQLAGNNPNISI